MTITYGRVMVECDRATETDGRITLWSGETPIRTLANLPPHIEITVEGGEIEHVPTPLEAAEEEINGLQAELAEAWDVIARIRALITALGESPTLSGLLKFLVDLKAILADLIIPEGING